LLLLRVLRKAAMHFRELLRKIGHGVPRFARVLPDTHDTIFRRNARSNRCRVRGGVARHPARVESQQRRSMSFVIQMRTHNARRATELHPWDRFFIPPPT
jgi:hypothetical protein